MGLTLMLVGEFGLSGTDLEGCGKYTTRDQVVSSSTDLRIAKNWNVIGKYLFCSLQSEKNALGVRTPRFISTPEILDPQTTVCVGDRRRIEGKSQ